ncbi:hypothetical protein [Nonomuraea sp. NEAU-A123]|uniref:hypothetical protein n=1 Tax=Nonomuraea sp. NEAU-A123 TaxID=2839649 RepID=UPI001BE4B30B|nr:hypothetical protein [Nonomuraea sp. NEAU-A123]MBT2235452.1 hypothetical protein [Nonomuraea sp. NEAU-A123]
MAAAAELGARITTEIRYDLMGACVSTQVETGQAPGAVSANEAGELVQLTPAATARSSGVHSTPDDHAVAVPVPDQGPYKIAMLRHGNPGTRPQTTRRRGRLKGTASRLDT